MGTLVMISGERHGESYPLGRRTNVVGRAESLPIQILDDRVSRKHLQICFDGRTNTYVAVDMNSRNGAYVNDDRITAATVLTNRDRIRVGNTLLLFVDRDGNSDAPALHRLKKAGESIRLTRLEAPADYC